MKQRVKRAIRISAPLTLSISSAVIGADTYSVKTPSDARSGFEGRFGIQAVDCDTIVSRWTCSSKRIGSGHGSTYATGPSEHTEPSAPTRVANLLVDLDFENGQANSGYPGVGWTNSGVEPVKRRSVIIDSTGNSAVRHEERKGDPPEAGASRTESNNQDMREVDFKDDQTRYYGWSIYFPDDHVFDGKLDDIVFQWKTRGKKPSIFMTQKYDRLYMRVNSDFRKGLRYEVTNGPLQLGVWHDFRMKVIWEADNTYKGLIELDHKIRGRRYRRAFSDRGPNMYDSTGYLKWGIYKPNLHESQVTSRVVYHDNIRIGTDWESVSLPE